LPILSTPTPAPTPSSPSHYANVPPGGNASQFYENLTPNSSSAVDYANVTVSRPDANSDVTSASGSSSDRKISPSQLNSTNSSSTSLLERARAAAVCHLSRIFHMTT